MTTATHTSSTASAPGRRAPMRALVTAEYRQFLRNRTLVWMGTTFPVGIPLVTYFATRRSTGTTPDLVTTTIEMAALMALLFVQYYSVLSMVTTRRAAGVLRRLRTGEATDRQILTAPAAPGAALSVVTILATCAVVYATGGSPPVNPVALVLAVCLGLVLFTVLALATTAFTRNAEAAQITSIPVITVAMFGLSSVRTVLPEDLARFADFTPFAAISDLISLGTVGHLVDGGPALEFADTFGAMGRPIATLLVWIIVSAAAAAKAFRWDQRG